MRPIRKKQGKQARALRILTITPDVATSVGIDRVRLHRQTIAFQGTNDKNDVRRHIGHNESAHQIRVLRII